MRTEGATVWAAAPNPDNRYGSDWLLSGQNMLARRPASPNYSSGQMSICVSQPAGGRRARPPLRLELQFGAV